MALEQCTCIEGMICHFCQEELVDDDQGMDDSNAWCDWVVTTPNPARVAGDELAATYTPPPETTRKHVIAHFYCADEREGVERG